MAASKTFSIQKILAIIVLAIVALTSNYNQSFARQYYGAIAFSPSTRAYGMSYNFSTKAGAQRDAMRRCRRAGRGCISATWFRNACGAIAIGRTGWGTGWGTQVSIARRQALRVCRRRSRGCGVKRWVCTRR